jgi:hypothetical protein
MNETKQVWKDVAAILKESGWPESNKEGEAVPLRADEQTILLSSLPSRKEPWYYRWLPAGAVTALVICFLASFLIVGSHQGKPREQNLTALREQTEKLQQHLSVLEGGHAKIKRSLEGLDKGSSSLTGNNKTLEKKVDELQEDNQRMKQVLKNVLKAQEDLLQTLAKEMWLAPILCTRRCESRINRYRCVLGPA